MSGKRQIADILFGAQIIGAFILCGSQFFRLLETTNGQLLSMLFFVEAYYGLHFVLAVSAHCAQSSRTTRQTVWTYAIWFVLFGSNIAAIFLNGYQWSHNDARVVTFVLFGAVLVFAVMKFRGGCLQDPMPKSFFAMLCKALPQFIVAFEIAQKGGASFTPAAIIAGNINIFIRISQIWFAIREAGWDRNRIWLCISEAMNEVSWATISIVWFFS